MHTTQSADWFLAWQDGALLGPDGPLHVERVHETHTAWVFLTATQAFKLRKPVDLGFLDYSSIDKRRRAAETEVNLGSRISPHVYLGVWTHADGAALTLQTAGGSGEPLVAMKRLPDSLQLERLFLDPETPAARIDEVARACARFHATCPSDRRSDGYGAIASTIAAWTINFEQLPVEDASIPLSAGERERLIEETAAWLDRMQPLLAERIAEGRIREGHGDLRLQHIYLTQPWSVIDPLEFAIELRFCDVAAEVCFVAMELDDLGRMDASERMLSQYAAETDDNTLARVAAFFKRYRAVVRAKVEWIRACQAAGEQRRAHLAASRRLFELALRYRSNGQ
ncbi:MAG: hypothetical protein JNJ46_09695 [Myxococcales bacterium]|nr:hypothetical protein [Myxococcales bacterium]